MKNPELQPSTPEKAQSIFQIEAGLNPLLLEARKRDFSAKLFYSLVREASEQRIEIIDIGSTIEIDPTDEPLLNRVINTSHQESVQLGEHTKYASSWGTHDLRGAISEFFQNWGNIHIDPNNEVMVTRGIIDSIQKTIEAIDVSHVIVPSMAPYFPETFARFKGKTILSAPLNLVTGEIDLDTLTNDLNNSDAKRGKVLMYITHPSAPAGTVMHDEFIENRLIPFLKQNNIWLISDSYISSARFDGKPLKPILSFRDAKDIAVEAITVSKEIGLPGARAGGIAGNSKIIEALRIHAASTIDTIPLPFQRLAAKALREVDPAISAKRIAKELAEEILPRFNKMNWPVIEPKAGIDMLVAVPPGFIRTDIPDPSLAASVSILRRFGIALFPCSIFDPEGTGKFFLRLVLKQRGGKIPKALDLLSQSGFDWNTIAPTTEDFAFISETMNKLDLTKL